MAGSNEERGSSPLKEIIIILIKWGMVGKRSGQIRKFGKQSAV